MVNCQDQPKVEQKQEPIENLPVKPPKVEKPFTANDPEGKEITWNKDGAQMVLIPAGSFRMGANDPEDWMKDAQPVYTVELVLSIWMFMRLQWGSTNSFLRQLVTGICQIGSASFPHRRPSSCWGQLGRCPSLC